MWNYRKSDITLKQKNKGKAVVYAKWTSQNIQRRVTPFFFSLFIYVDEPRDRTFAFGYTPGHFSLQLKEMLMSRVWPGGGGGG